MDRKVVPIVPSFEDEWRLEGDATENRERQKSPRGPGIVVSARLDPFTHRTLEEIAASGIDPRIKTITDCMRDGATLFIEDWVKNYADGISGRLVRNVRMEMKKRQYDAQTEFLEKVDEMIDHAKKLEDDTELESILTDLKEEYDQTSAYAPPVHIKEVRKRIAEVTELLKKPYIQ